MEDKEKVKQRFELLKIARELLNEEYINRRAEDHNKWIAENEILWRASRRNLPYPPFAQYPTDEELVRAATNLYNFIYTQEHAASAVVVPVEAVATARATEQEPEPEPTIADKPLPEPAEEHNTIKKLLPGWIRRADIKE